MQPFQKNISFAYLHLCFTQHIMKGLRETISVLKFFLYISSSFGCIKLPTTSFLNYRLGTDLLSEDRGNLLKTNKEELARLIQLKETLLLDKLNEDNVITQQDKEVIQVSFTASLFTHNLTLESSMFITEK